MVLLRSIYCWTPLPASDFRSNFYFKYFEATAVKCIICRGFFYPHEQMHLPSIIAFPSVLWCRRKQSLQLHCASKVSRAPLAAPQGTSCCWHAEGSASSRAGLQTGTTRFPRHKVINLPVPCTCKRQFLSHSTYRS